MNERGVLALITTSFPTRRDGSEAAGAFVADLVEALSEHMDIRVIAPGVRDSIETQTSAIEIHRFSAPETPLSTLKLWRPDHQLEIIKVLRSGQRKLSKAMESGSIEHILALWALPSGHWARQASKKTGTPYTVWALGSDIWSLGRIPLLRSYLRRILADAEKCYADGLGLCCDVEQIGGAACDFLPSARCHQINHSRHPSNSPPYRLAYLGRWHPNKGVDMFMDALHRLSDDDWAKIAEVRVNGGGPLAEYVHQAVTQLKRQGRPVVVGGYLDTEAAGELIDWTDYLVLPSRIESIPVIFSDAAQLRRPIVATPVGDLPRLFEKHKFGVLAAQASAEAIAIAIREALKTPASCFEPQLATHARKFDIGIVARQVVQNFKSFGDV